MPSRQPRFSHRRSDGMSLVEVLVTLVSTSVGVLGIAALQLATLRSNHDAYMQLQATALATSMLERIRSNPSGFRSGDYDRVDFNSTAAASVRAQADLEAWQTDIDRQLPGGSPISAGSIQRQAGSNLVTITVRWKALATAGQAANARTLSVQSEL